MDEPVQSKDEQKPESVVPEPVIEEVRPQEPNQTVFTTEVVPQVVPEAISEKSPEEEVVPENITPQELETDGMPPGGLSPPAGSFDHEENSHKVLYIGIAVGIFVFILIFVGIFKLLAGAKKSTAKTTLTYWGLWEDKEILKPLIDEYQKENSNITINYEKLPPQNYREKLLARGRDGRGPDIFRFHNTWLPTIKDIAAPLPSKIMSASEFDKTFYPVAKSDLKIEKNYYGIPLEIDGLVLLYNEDLLNKSGIGLPPKTWDDIIDYSNRLTVKDDTGHIITAGIALGTAENIAHFSDILGFMLLQNGADLNDLTSPEAVDTLTAFRKFADLPEPQWDQTMPNSVSAFITEKVGMIIVPSWQILTVKAANPDLQFKVAALPVVPGGSEVSLASYWVEGVSRYSKNQNEAWKFLKFLVEKENLTKLYAQQTKTRPFGEPYSRVDLRESLLQNEYIGPVVAQAPKMKSLPVVSFTYDNGINDEIISYLKDAVNATINGVSAPEAMDNAKLGVAQIFAKYAK